jgi:lysophospholipase L1-like esterase
MKHSGSVYVVGTTVSLVAIAACSSNSSTPETPKDASAQDGHAVVDASPASDAPGDASIDASTVDAAPDTGGPAVRRIGRFDLSSPASPTAEWSASSMQARFTGTSVSAAIGGANNYFAAVVDGTLGPVIVTDAGTSYPVATGLSPGTHEVTLVRRDEAFDEPSQLLGFTFGAGGALLPPPVTPNRRIEVIGDSISAGYGVECTNASQHFSQTTENAYDAYGPVTSRAVSADLHLIAWSGKGLYQNDDGTMTETMPILWLRTIPTDATSMWNFASWIPDAVVINLGTNDYAVSGPDPTANFTTAYLAFVAQIRTVYPKAQLFLSVGPMLSGTHFTEAEGAIESVIASRKTAGDTALSLVVFPTQDCGSDGSGCGCDYHPNVATQASMATILEGSLHTALGW